MFGALLLFVDLIMLPLEVFTIDDVTKERMYYFNLGMFFYWVIDLPLQFVIGIQVDGMIDMRPGPIARQYMRSWLFPDSGLLGNGGKAV